MKELTTNFDELRHKWEIPMIWVSIALTVISICLGSWLFSLDEAAIAEMFGEDTQSIMDFARFSISVLVLPIGIFFYRFYMAAKAKSNAILVGPDQLPGLWTMYQDLGIRLNMKSLPKLYVTNGNGVVNAYALSCNTRHKYIVMHSEVVLAMDEKPEIAEFVLAHEMAHHKLRHVSLWRIVIGIIPNVLPPIGVSTTRAQEYSADRVALSVCHHHQGAMNLLAIGPWLHSDIDPETWLKQCENEHNEFYVRVANILSDHAVMVKRYKALRDLEKNGADSHGGMF